MNLFVASHHGRENGYCQEVMSLCGRIDAVVISDKYKGYQSQDVDEYRRHATGLKRANGDTRRVLTTRRDGAMRFDFPAFDLFTCTPHRWLMPVAA